MTDELRSVTLQSALYHAWSAETSSKWLPDNPARGQCSVTALVVQDILGGDIVKTDVEDAWHFYNLIDDMRRDFSESQFTSPVFYADVPSSRDEAFSDTSPEQYRILRERVLAKTGPRDQFGGLSPQAN
ncbi:hypothetical protein MesoLjLc_54310 [Mesorhizobium sp. L-8-10]|uniref:YunG family protein n=1 Tax=Mesorhizobium sp. L-8-10 TaxID=2744523 RepID=UPI00192519C4|nr:hypothetical protein [Mesorhizobium sp. L-8-10]BCH33501.1 hypothetical protein MesoLjLc_54310 [Mesorhizobium sp. L-8-10]